MLGGTIVTGNLVSVNHFHKSLKHTMLDNLKEMDDRETFRGLHSVLENLDVPALNFNYLCVENARIYQQSGYYTVQVPFWIGKMQKVDGFSLGEIEIPSQSKS